MDVERYENPEAVSRAAAERFQSAAVDAVRRRGCFRVALSGGKTPARLYRLLSMAPFRDQVPWPQVDFFWSDERDVPPEHPESNFRLANEAMLRPLGIDPCRMHAIDAATDNPVAAAAAYEQRIASVFGARTRTEVPRFDLVLLGLGADAHTASLFPGTRALGERERWIVANPVPSLRTVRYTMTPPLLNRARLVLFLVTGADKADALRLVLQGERDPVRWPAQLVWPQGRLVWMVDRAAAACLSLPEDAPPERSA